MNEDAPINSAGDGSQIALPPAHIIVGKKNRSKYKKNNGAKYDGLTVGFLQLEKISQTIFCITYCEI